MTPDREEALRRPSADRLKGLRDYYLGEHSYVIDGEGDVAELFAEIDALAAELEAAEKRLGELDEQRVAAVHALEVAEREIKRQEDEKWAAENRADEAEHERDVARKLLAEVAQGKQARDLAITRQALLDISRAYAPSPGWLRERIDAAFRSLNMSDELGGF